MPIRASMASILSLTAIDLESRLDVNSLVACCGTLRASAG